MLLVEDQLAGRLPDRCVLSGARTDGAVRVTAVIWTRPRWLLGVPGAVPFLALRGARRRLRVVLPVSRGVWRRWQRRNLAALGAIASGIAFIATGPFRGDSPVAAGVLLVLAGAAYRARAAHNYWVTCRFDPGRRTVTVEPTHPEFDRAARELFQRSLLR